MKEELERRTIAFVRAMAEPCRTCVRRDRCHECPSGWASRLMRDISAENVEDEQDYTLAARIERIMSILREADRPLQSNDIKIDDICSRQLKYWTLCALFKWGRINRTRENGHYRYFINEKEGSKNEDHNTRDRER